MPSHLMVAVPAEARMRSCGECKLLRVVEGLRQYCTKVISSHNQESLSRFNEYAAERVEAENQAIVVDRDGGTRILRNTRPSGRSFLPQTRTSACRNWTHSWTARRPRCKNLLRKRSDPRSSSRPMRGTTAKETVEERAGNEVGTEGRTGTTQGKEGEREPTRCNLPGWNRYRPVAL